MNGGSPPPLPGAAVARDPVGGQQRRQQEGDERDLADLHPGIEGGERRHQRPARQAEFLQCAREAEAVHEAEEKADAPAPLDVVRDEILHRDEDDGGGDGRLHHRWTEAPQCRARRGRA